MIPINLYQSLTKNEKAIIDKVVSASLGIGESPFYLGLIKEDITLFRVTSYFPLDRKFSKVDVQYPPISMVKNTGRCNYAKQSIFYASDSIYGALLEKSEYFAGSKTGNEKLFLSKWSIKKPFYVVDFLLKTTTDKTNPSLKKYIEKRIEDIALKNIDSESIINELSFIGDNFSIEGESAYPFTSILCNLVYKQQIDNKYISGIEYVGTKVDYSYKKKLENYNNLSLITDIIEKDFIVLTDVIEMKISSEIGNEIEIILATENSSTIEKDIDLNNINCLNSKRQKEIKDLFIQPKMKM